MDDVIGCSVPSSHWVDCHTVVLSWVGQTSIVYQHAAISKGLEPPYKDKPNISLSKFLYKQYNCFIISNYVPWYCFYCKSLLCQIPISCMFPMILSNICIHKSVTRSMFFKGLFCIQNILFVIFTCINYMK